MLDPSGAGLDRGQPQSAAGRVVTYVAAVFHDVNGDVIVVHARCGRVDARKVSIVVTVVARTCAAVPAVVVLSVDVSTEQGCEV